MNDSKAIIDEDSVIHSEERRLHRPLTTEERKEVHHTIEFLKEHQGHESAHGEMLLIMLVSLLVSQMVITLWKKYHPRSYNISTLLGLWLVPFLMALYNAYYRFVLFWVAWSIINSYIVKLSLESPMNSSTPKIVYSWYAWVYRGSYLLVAVGYCIVIIAIFHISLALGFVKDVDEEASVFETGIVIMFYGLYFGTLGRDFVDRLADRMATSMGYYSRTGFPKKHLRENTCAICGDSTKSSDEKLHQLECNHTYHEQCIRGWTIIGKKDVCPYCKEKVNLNAFKKNPWEITEQLYLNLLDSLRYVLVWNPIVFLLVHVVFKILGLR